MGTYRNPLTDYTPETEAFPFEQRFEQGGASVFSESQEMQLASEFLELSSEQELEQFLGDLIKGVGSAIGGIVKSPRRTPPAERALRIAASALRSVP